MLSAGILLASALSIIVVSSYSSIERDQQDQNTLINNEVIAPYKSVSAVKTLKAGENMQFLVHYPLFGALLNAKITDSHETIVSDVNSTRYDRELLTTFTAQADGEYTVTITNLGTEQIPVHVVFSNVQSEYKNNNPFR